ncbi:uncharacterized protein ColSpa_06935 [Colletotrichum spaethianum]|uniref:Uncharacterized protein n=1 Tax=Colletotrichum spaethianum TaxID=700344 RepID=A0AA37LI82_9PEZI|nr:uncharacterized protein ColSpa_06935 [Colletotrichum spaethianum]GKT46754.1 hypothetical protein ColSpa_06935 [Colletotrichum spaethianum]
MVEASSKLVVLVANGSGGNGNGGGGNGGGGGGGRKRKPEMVLRSRRISLPVGGELPFCTASG